MNTKEIGDALELQVYHYLQKLKTDGNLFGLDVNKFEILHKHSIKSSDSNELIEFDIVIKPVSVDGFMLNHFLVFECKNYSNDVNIKDIRDFKQRISEVGAKGVFITNSKISETGRKLFQLDNIAYGRWIEKSNDIHWILKRKPKLKVIDSSKEHLASRMFNDEIVIPFVNLVVVCENEIYFDVSEYLYKECPQYFLLKPTEVRIVKFLKKEQIRSLAQEFYDKQHRQSFMLDVMKLCEELGFECFPVDLLSKSDVIGSINFTNKQIIYDKSLTNNTSRLRFTVAHELGHYLLNHNQYISYDKFDDENSIPYSVCNNFKYFELNSLEFQANYFASYLLLPENEFKYRLNNICKKYDIRDRGNGLFYLDSQPANNKWYNIVINDISGQFVVSKQLVIYRMKELNLLNDKRQPQSLGGLLSTLLENRTVL